MLMASLTCWLKLSRELGPISRDAQPYSILSQMAFRGSPGLQEEKMMGFVIKVVES